MKLTSEQIEQFDREGYLFFPRLFSAGEIRTLIGLDKNWITRS